ncbi:MAG: OmpA family protein [Planctomycetota bacterium]
MRNLKLGVAIVSVVVGMTVWAGCDGQPQPQKPRTLVQKGEFDSAAYASLQKEYQDLQTRSASGDLKNKELMELIKYYQGREGARTILTGEVDGIIDDLLKFGGSRDQDRITLEDQFFFKAGSANLTEQGENYLLNIAKELRKIDYLIRIEGHTDPTPLLNPENKRRFGDNWGLSAARAAAVVRFLQERGGIPGERLTGVFYGPYRPVAANTKEGNSKNRRVEIRLVPPYTEQEMKIDLVREPGQPSAVTDDGFRSTDSFLGGDKPEIPRKSTPVPTRVETPVKPAGGALEGIVPVNPVPEKTAPPATTGGGTTEPASDEAPVIIK